VRVAVTRRLRPGLVAIDLSALDQVETPDETSCLLRAGAGAAVQAVEDRAIAAGLTLGPLLPSTGRKKVGAWLAGPTRGERTIPPGRLETVALAIEAVLPDGSLYRSRETPRSATGPDLDHLLLGGEGRFGIVTRTTLRLFPRALSEAAGAREARGVLDAIEAARQAVHEGLLPAEVRWDKPRGTVEARFTGPAAAQRARKFGGAAIGGHEVAGHLELAGTWRAWAAASPLRPSALQLVALHVDGALGALEFNDEADAERAAVSARHMGFVVVSPRRLRVDAAQGWQGAAHPLHEALAASIDPNGVFAR
jgi:FAD/FMN-containing dehydrogenase